MKFDLDRLATGLAPRMTRRRLLGYAGTAAGALGVGLARPGDARADCSLPCGNGGCCLSDGSEVCCLDTGCVLTGYPCCPNPTGGIYTCSAQTDECCASTTHDWATCIPAGSDCCSEMSTMQWCPAPYKCCVYVPPSTGVQELDCCSSGQTCDPQVGCRSQMCVSGVCQ